jgi:hypothetical protein
MTSVTHRSYTLLAMVTVERTKRYSDRETSILKEKEELKGNHRMTNDHGDRNVSNHLERRTPMHDETKANHSADEAASAPSISSSWMVGTRAVALP